MAVPGMKQNRLMHVEVYRLTKAVEELKEPFRDWDEAIRQLSAVINRAVTRPNIETAAESCGVSIDRVVAGQCKRTKTKLGERLRQLESRIAALEWMMTQPRQQELPTPEPGE